MPDPHHSGIVPRLGLTAAGDNQCQGERTKGLDGATHSPAPRIGWGHPLSGTKEMRMPLRPKEMWMAPFVLLLDVFHTKHEAQQALTIELEPSGAGLGGF